jgi:predicted regulator of Ras-like GTPase activity (Roadblock/LC7/MglB family)
LYIIESDDVILWFLKEIIIEISRSHRIKMKMVVIGIEVVVGKWTKVEGNIGNGILAMMMVEERDGKIIMMILREVALVTVAASGWARRQTRTTQV